MAMAGAAIALLGTGCGGSAAEHDLEEARELWESQELERYVIDISGSAIYLKSPEGVERWPLDPTPVLCE
jgi:hypothetical protein